MARKNNKTVQLNQNKNENKKSYFACANTCLGFVNLFNTIYNSKELEKIYIIKGCGSSSVLNKILREAENKKYKAEYFLCPNDVNFLNGI